MEASAIPASAGLARTRIALGAPLLRIRSDEQLVSLFRAGSEDAFRVIHDRYRHRMFAYARQMLAGSSVDPEDAVQEVFVRAYRGLRANDHQLALRAWLYRIAHNHCIDELRRPQATASEQISPSVPNQGASDPVATLERRDALRRLIADVQRLPDQQRSALLMRELAGMSYADVSGALGVSVPAVKSLLVRARVGLAQADAARDTACARIRADLIVAHDRGVRASGLARRHLRDCPDCRRFRSEVRGVSRELAGLVPALGPLGVVAKLLGFGGSGGAAAGGTLTGGGATAGGTLTGGGAAAATGAASTATAASAGAIASAGHVVTILAAAVVTAGGAIELQHIAPSVVHHSHPRAVAATVAAPLQPRTKSEAGTGVASALPASTANSERHGAVGRRSHATSRRAAVAAPLSVKRMLALVAKGVSIKVPLTELVDPDHLSYLNPASGRAGSTRLGTTGSAATTAGGAAACAGALAATGAGIVTGAGSSGATSAGAGAGAGGTGAGGTGSTSTGSAGAGSTSTGSTGTASTGAGGTGAGSGATGSTSTGPTGACTGSSGASTGAAGSGTGAAGSGTGSGTTATGSGTGATGSSTGATGSSTSATGSSTGTTGSGAGSSGSSSGDYASTASGSGTSADGGPARATAGGTSSGSSSGAQSGGMRSGSGGASTATRDSTTASAGGAGSTSATGSRSQTGQTGAVAVFTVTGS